MNIMVKIGLKPQVPPERQPDAVLNQPNPVSGTRYPVLDTTGNVRITGIHVWVTWTGQPTPLEIWVTLSGKTERFFVSNPASDTEQIARWGGQVCPDNTLAAVALTDRAFLIEDRSIKIEAEISGGVVSNLSVRVKWARWP